MKSNIQEIVISAIAIALCTTLMILTGVLSIAAFVMPMMSGLIISVMQIELNNKRSFEIFISTSILSFIFCPDKESFVIFVLFTGLYPILKYKLNNIHSLIIKILLKFAIYLISSILIFTIFTYILMVPEDFFNIFGIPVKILTVIFLFISFLLYDLAIDKFIRLYVYNILPQLKNWGLMFH